MLADLIATLYWVCSNLGHEANPVMGFFLDISPLLFVIMKLGLSCVGIGILYFFRKRFTGVILKILMGLNAVYIGVFIYHLWGLLFLVLATN